MRKLFSRCFSESFRKNLLKKEVLALKNSANSSKKYVFTTYITRKDGVRIYAKEYGLKAFRILVK